MAGRIELVAAGAAAEEALAESIRLAQASDRLAPVTVVARVPVVALDLRRRLVERAAIAGVQFLPLNRLVELLGVPGPAAQGNEDGREAAGPDASRRPLTAAALGAAIRHGLDRSSGPLSSVADHPATEESLVSAYRMLRPLEDGDRRQLASMSSRAAAVVRVVETARAALEPGFYDSDDLARWAAERVRTGAVDLADVGEVVLYLPDPLGPAPLDLLSALADRSRVAVIAGVTGEAAADRAARRLVEALSERGFELADADDRRPRQLLDEDVKPVFDRAIGAPDLEEEVRTAVRLLVAHATEGGDLGRAALAYPSFRAGLAYPSVIAELLAAAGIPWTGPASDALAGSGAGDLVLAAFRLLLASDPALERSAVISWLSSPSLSPKSALLGLPAGEAIPVGAFDRCSRAAGVVAGADEWRSRLGAYAKRSADRLRTGAPAEVATRLRQVVQSLDRCRDELLAATSWAALAAFARDFAARVTEAGEERDRLVAALAELAHLDALEPLASPAGGGAVGGGGAGRFERQVLSAVASAVGRRSGNRRHGRFGAGPVVGPIAVLAGIRTDLLVVLGATESVLPSRTPDDPLVTEIERDAIRLLKERERVEERDRRTLLTLLGGAKRAVVTYPRVGEGASRLTHPSRWLVGDLFTGQFEQIPSFAAGVAKVATGAMAPADAADLELALIRIGTGAGEAIDELAVARASDLAARVVAERERLSSGLTRFSGLVGHTGDVLGEVMSATRLEHLATCPLRFMFDRLVRLDVLEAPDRRHAIEPRDRGSLVHAILDDFVVETVVEPGRFSGWGVESLETLRAVAERQFSRVEQLGLTGKPVYWRMARARIFADLERFVAIESGRLLESGSTPVRTELGFAMHEGEAPLVVDAGGRQIRFRGTIDRVDAGPGDALRVVDYKTGKASPFAAIERREDPLDGGRHLQLPVYAKAARALLGASDRTRVVAEYRFCSQESGFKVVSVDLTKELDERFSSVVETLVATVERGTFPPRPAPGNGSAGSGWPGPSASNQQQSHCRGCDFDSVCRLDREVVWRRAEAEETMRAYVELVSTQRDSR